MTSWGRAATVCVICPRGGGGVEKSGIDAGNIGVGREGVVYVIEEIGNVANLGVLKT